MEVIEGVDFNMRIRWTYTGAIATLVGLTLLPILLGNEPIHACDCEETASPIERRDEATAVFQGRVVDMQFEDWPFDIETTAVPLDEPLTVEFIVHKVWKGDVPRILRLTTARTAPCGFEFKNFQDYLVYADGKKGSLVVRGCSRTQLIANAQGDLNALGESHAPGHASRRPVKPATLDCYASSDTTYAGALTWPLILVGGLAWLGLRSRKGR